MARLLAAAAVLYLLPRSCALPPFDAEGEYVRVGTDTVPQLCEGSLARLDEGVERVEDQLGLLEPKERLKVAILFPEEGRALCQSRSSCVVQVGTDRVVILATTDFETSAVHELGHARLGPYRSGAIKLFSEGVAVAVSPAPCRSEGVDTQTLDELLTVGPWDDLNYAGYYLGGELVTWLLDVHGPNQVLEFIGTLRRPEALAEHPDPETVRSNYRAYFGTELEDDIHAHLRSADELSPWDVGCEAPALTWDAGQIHLEGKLSCDSPRVVNDFVNTGRVYIDWTMTTPEGEDRYRLLDELPPETSLSITRCRCDLATAHESGWWYDDSPVGSNIELGPGVYRVRWKGRLSTAAELDVRIEAYH